MAKEIQYSAITGMNIVCVGNSNLDGATGSYTTIITGSQSGVLIKTVRIKAQTDTTHGMIRLFVDDGVDVKIISEIEVPVTKKSTTDPTFESIIPLNYHLKSGGILKASTQNGSGDLLAPDRFNIFAEGLRWTYYGSIRPESTKFTANTGMATISTQNSNLDGSGTIDAILTAASSGTLLQSIVIKALATTTKGMVRLFIDDTKIKLLFSEIFVPVIARSGTAHSFSYRIDFSGHDFALESGSILRASTEIGESFNIIAEGLDWVYPA